MPIYTNASEFTTGNLFMSLIVSTACWVCHLRYRYKHQCIMY